MHLNIFSYILIIVLLCIVIKDFNKPLETIFKHVLTVGLIISFNTNLGDFMQMGSASIGYTFIINLILVVLGSILLFSRKHYNRAVLKLGSLVVLSVLVGLIGAYLRPYSGGIILDYDLYVGGDLSRLYDLTVSVSSYQFVINMLCFFVIASTVYNVYAKEDLIKTIKFILNTSVIVVASVFVLEFIGNYMLGESMAEHLFIPIFGYSHPTSVNIDRFHGLFKETSHYALALFFLSLLCIIDVNLKKQSNSVGGVWFGIIRYLFFSALLAISTSFVGIFYLAVSLLLYIVFNAKLLVKKLSFWLVIFFSLILLCLIITGHENIIPKYDRVERLFHSFVRILNGERAIASSEGARLTSMHEMLILVAARPLFGIGASLADAHSTILSMLGTIGILGTGLWISALVKLGRVRSQQFLFVFLIIFALTFSGGNGGLLEMRLLFLFAAIGCVKLKLFRPSRNTKLRRERADGQTGAVKNGTI